MKWQVSDSNEISLYKGEIVQRIEKLDESWWSGTVCMKGRRALDVFLGDIGVYGLIMRSARQLALYA